MSRGEKMTGKMGEGTERENPGSTLSHAPETWDGYDLKIFGVPILFRPKRERVMGSTNLQGTCERLQPCLNNLTDGGRNGGGATEFFVRGLDLFSSPERSKIKEGSTCLVYQEKTVRKDF